MTTPTEYYWGLLHSICGPWWKWVVCPCSNRQQYATGWLLLPCGVLLVPYLECFGGTAEPHTGFRIGETLPAVQLYCFYVRLPTWGDKMCACSVCSSNMYYVAIVWQGGPTLVSLAQLWPVLILFLRWHGTTRQGLREEGAVQWMTIFPWLNPPRTARDSSVAWEEVQVEEEPWNVNCLVGSLPLFHPTNLCCPHFLKPGVREEIPALPTVCYSVAPPCWWATAGNSCSAEYLVRFKDWYNLGMRGRNRRWDRDLKDLWCRRRAVCTIPQDVQSPV